MKTRGEGAFPKFDRSGGEPLIFPLAFRLRIEGPRFREP